MIVPNDNAEASSPAPVPLALEGVRVRRLTAHPDDRGSFTEAFRREWDTGIDPVQWNMVSSRPGVLRGVHVHVHHTDILIVAAGTATIGLSDLREGSPTNGLGTAVRLEGHQPGAITIPPGVAHGFLFHEPTITIYGVSRYWDVDDELGCHWSDPGLGIEWPFHPTLLSQRDRDAGSLSDLLAELSPFQPIGAPTDR
jgi:dTDP-4-dehydrorhamnose 3,5-epimerase